LVAGVGFEGTKAGGIGSKLALVCYGFKDATFCKCIS